MEYELIPLDPSNLDEAVRLCDAHVGQGLYTKETLTAAMGNAPAHQFVLLQVDGAYVGYFYTHILEVDQLKTVPGLSAEQCIGLVNPSDRVGVLRSLGLDEEPRKKGMADTLVRLYTQELFDQGCDVVLALAWEVQGMVPLHNVLRKNGFNPMYQVDRPWKKIKGLRCPACGQRSCSCNGVLYYQKKDSYYADPDWV